MILSRAGEEGKHGFRRSSAVSAVGTDSGKQPKPLQTMCWPPLIVNVEPVM